MTTVLVWLGSGFAFSVGICLGAWMFLSRAKALNEKADTLNQQTGIANDLLRDRNAIGHRQAVALEKLASDEGEVQQDEWAGQAMQALIAKIPLFDRLGEQGIAKPTIEEIHQVRRDVAQSAFDYADAMREERAKRYEQRS